MNCLKSYIDEQIRTIVYEDGVVATPGNTMGMGNPMAPTDTAPGSEPIIVGPRKKRKNTKNKICPKIKESLLDDDDDFYGANSDKKIIDGWIHDNYGVTGKLTISDDFVVNCSGDVTIKNRNMESLTNGLFRWGRIGRRFYCSHCAIASLEGAPKEVMNSFDCSGCHNLKSLEGAPKAVGIHFWCNACEELESLEGAPEAIGGSFDCTGCDKLTSLEGSPKRVAGYFNCSYCGGLTSLEGAPEKVGGCLYCKRCKNLKITDSERKKYKIRDLM